MQLKKMGIVFAFSIYIIAGLLMFVQTHCTIPYLSLLTGEEPIVFWFLVGALGIFLPLFLGAIYILKREGYSLNSKIWRERMRFTKMTKRDWVWSIAGIVVIMLLSMAVMEILKAIYGSFDASPSFMKFTPFNITGKYWLFVIWLVYWVFNIMGEEILWRGVMQPRLEATIGKFAWLVQSSGWIIFHIAFGWKLLIVMLPLLIIQPFIMQRTKNAWSGVLIHGVINGPSFILIALGII